MKPSRILLLNFLSHVKTELKFTDGLYVLQGANHDRLGEGASNGAGKSAILYAIIWALWGRLPQDSVLEDVIRHDSEGTHVELDLFSAGGTLRIIRSKNRKGSQRLSAYWNKECLGEELAVVQPKLEQIYGVSWATFCNTVFLGPQSEAAQFVKATAEKRGALLAELINDQMFQEAGGRVGAEMALLKTAQEKTLSVIVQLEQSSQQLLGDIQRLSTAFADEQQVQRAKEVATREQVHQLELSILRAQEKLKSPPQASPVELRARWNTLEEEVQRVNSRIAAAHFRLSQACPTVGSRCATCGQQFSTQAADELQGLKLVIEEEVRSETLATQNLRSLQAGIQAQIDEAQQWAQVKSGLERDIDNAKLQIYQAKQGLVNRAMEIIQVEQQSAQARLKDVRGMLQEKQTENHNANLRLPILKTIHTGFTKEIRNMLLDDVRSILQFHTSQILEALAGDEFTVEFPPTSVTGRERFEIEVKKRGKRNKLTSGGEGYRVQLAIILALALAMKHQQKSPFQFLMIDEALGFVDPEGARAIGKLVTLMVQQKHFSQIFVTSPMELEDLHGSIISVQRRNYISTVEV